MWPLNAGQSTSTFVELHEVNGKVRNPAYLYGEYQAFGLFGVLYLILVLLRGHHDTLLEKTNKSTFEKVLAVLEYIPRTLFLVYEFALNIILYIPIRITNAFLNREPEYLTKEQYSPACEKIKAYFDQVFSSRQYGSDCAGGTLTPATLLS